MNEVLDRINSVLVEVQNYIEPDVETLLQVHEQDENSFLVEREKAHKRYKESVAELVLVLPKMLPEEMILGYREGGKLLQRVLSGYMGKFFHSQYSPLMIEAIHNAHEHTAWIFLQVLAKELDSGYEEIIAQALHSSSAEVRYKALNIVDEMEMVDVVLEVQALTHDSIEAVATLAKDTIHRLKDKGLIVD